MQNVIFETEAIRLEFSAANGALLSAKHCGEEVASPAVNLFSLQLLDRKGNSVRLAATDFPTCVYADGCFRYAGCAQFPDLVFQVYIRRRGRFIAFTNAVSGVPADWALEWVDSPQIHVPGNQALFEPLHDGLLVTEPCLRSLRPATKYHVIEFTKRGQGFGRMFPMRCMMQYMASYGKEAGIYVAAYDSQEIPKAMEYEPLEDGKRLRLSMQTFTGCGFGSGYRTPFEYVVTGFKGDWRHAAQIYRDWYDTIAPASKPLPSWLEKSPVVAIYPVLGTGLDSGMNKLQPNCYYPYEKALPYIKKIQDEMESNVLALLMHWEGTAPWAPPYVWPPRGGEELLASFRDALHADGNLLGLYCSGTAWTQTSTIIDYSQEERCKKEGLERYMLRGPKGEIDANICNGVNFQRFGYDMCMSEQWCRDQVKEQIMHMARFGVDYAQYFDQNHGGGQHICYSQKHAHPPMPGPAQTEAMRTLLHELSEDIAAEGKEMALGCESSAAEPFVNELQLNDARASILWPHGRPVPAQAYIFHGRTMCFVGNQCCVGVSLDIENCPQNLLYRIAYGFNAGDLLSITLKNEGRIHWGWCLPWDYPEPDQENAITLVRNLNAVRKKYPQYLLHGRMELPTRKLTCGKWIMKTKNREIELPSVFDSAWSAADGSSIWILTNFLPEEQTAMVDGREIRLPALSATILEGK